jgi:mannose/fructose-specific phosphotransferase system component IIA
MSEPAGAASPRELTGVVVCHGRLAPALADAVAQISGVTGALVAVTNTDCDRGLLGDRIAAAVGAGPALVFVDMAAGSCMLAALGRLRDRPDVKVVTGVNLAMLVDFVFHRHLDAAGAAERASAIGQRAIKVP